MLALVPVVALGAVLGHELNIDVQQRYLETARSSAAVIAQIGIQPLITAQELSSGMTPAEIVDANQELQSAALNNEVRRIKVWNPSGVIVYSDNNALIGRTFPIDDDLGAALAGRSSANITTGQSQENAGDNLSGALIQVYVPLVLAGTSSPSGAFELYLPYAPVQAAIDHESQQLYGVLAAGLTLFYASMFPVALLADRWRRRLVREADASAKANLAVLERLNKLKSEFLTRISHQFRTALVGIQGFSELIRDSDDLDLTRVREFASDINSDAVQLDRAFSEMLELDRMETGDTVLEMVRGDLNQLIGEVVSTVGAQSPEYVLTTSLDAAVPPVPFDRERIAQVLTIILSNAIKYSPAGSEVIVSSTADEDSVEVKVKDHGPGMPREFVDGLFVGLDRQLTDAVHRKNGGNGGTGLGLAIARQVVEMHGGHISFDAGAGGGSEFHFTLPLQVRPSRGTSRTAPSLALKT